MSDIGADVLAEWRVVPEDVASLPAAAEATSSRTHRNAPSCISATISGGWTSGNAHGQRYARGNIRK